MIAKGYWFMSTFEQSGLANQIRAVRCVEEDVARMEKKIISGKRGRDSSLR